MEEKFLDTSVTHSSLFFNYKFGNLVIVTTELGPEAAKIESDKWKYLAIFID